MSSTHAFVRSQSGIINGIVVADDGEEMRKAVAEWAADASTEAILRVSLEVARQSLLKPTEYVIARMKS